MMQTSEQTNEISAALANAQAELENVEKGGNNPHFKSKYATLADVLSQVRPKFAKHGIAILQMPVNGDGSNIGVITRFTHSSGQWIESVLYIAPTKFDAQGAGSVISYSRRYALMAMAGVGADDDDGNAAVGRPQERAKTNGHGVPEPVRQSLVQAMHQQIAAVPHDPATGEIVPHAIPVPPTSDGSGTDWIRWGGQLIAAYKACKTRVEVVAWAWENADALEQCRVIAPKAYASITKAQKKMEGKLQGPEDAPDFIPVDPDSPLTDGV